MWSLSFTFCLQNPLSISILPRVPYALPILSILLDLFITQKFLYVLRLLIVYLLQFNIKLSFVITFILSWGMCIQSINDTSDMLPMYWHQIRDRLCCLNCWYDFFYLERILSLWCFSILIQKSIILFFSIAVLVPSDLLFSTKLNPYFASFHAALCSDPDL